MRDEDGDGGGTDEVRNLASVLDDGSREYMDMGCLVVVEKRPLPPGRLLLFHL
jgi:hypothetical protein